jgi:ElaB/YqjD/DUF883 family membrane-anchored ribosome-binding protein
MDNEPEVIRREMAETRASLEQKLETLEDKVVGTLESANSAVNQTVENVTGAVQETVTSVKETASDTVESVKDVFDLRLQVDRHPYLMMGAAVAVGYVGGSLLSRAAGHATRSDGRHLPPSGTTWPDERRPAASWVEERKSFPASSVPAVTDNGLASLLAPELASLKGMVIGYLMSLVRDSVVETLPSAMRPQFHQALDSMTHKLGGQPLHGPLLEAANHGAGTSARCGNGLEQRTTSESDPEFRRW